MHSPSLKSAVRRIRSLAASTDSVSDSELLARYRASRDERAFAALVARHGPAVLGTCRRVLADSHAAEDAFQATFLVLARRAGSVRRPAALGCWLYGVARRVTERHSSPAGGARRTMTLGKPTCPAGRLQRLVQRGCYNSLMMRCR